GERAIKKVGRTAQHDLGEVERADDGGEGDTEVVAGFGEHLVARGSGCGGCGERRLEPRGGQPGLQASGLAADAGRPARGADDDVADLARGEPAAVERAAAEEEAGADTVPDFDEHHVAV